VNVARRLGAFIALAAALGALSAPVGAQASFGIRTAGAEALNKDGSVDLRAGSHPYEYTVSFSMNRDAKGNPEGTLRDFIADLPAGMVGDPLAVPRCPGAAFEGQSPRCPGDTQIGIAHIVIKGVEAISPVYNLTPPLGVAASVGTSIINENSFQEASLRPSDYGVRISDITIPTDIELLSISETIWGVPMEASHNADRVCVGPKNELIHNCSSDIAPAAFLTLPTSCNEPLRTTLSVDSVQEPDEFKNFPLVSEDESGNPAALNGCAALPFTPTISARPETAAADSPTGLHVHLHLPQVADPKQVASAHLRDAVVTLPRGLAVNPSSADGLQGCSLAQVGLGEAGPARCPDASKVGTVAAQTPLLDHPLPGSVYIARQGENPFGSLIALYVVVEDPISGVTVKLAGKVEPDLQSGQLRATFRENPQAPIEDIDFEFFGGPRATLTTPPTCGVYTTDADFTPWSAPQGADALRSDSFAISAGAQGGGCPATEAQMPNQPSFEAGTEAPLAGSYSPFVLKLSRQNGSQRLVALNATLPPGLSAKLAGVQECSEAQIAAATARSKLGQGAQEQASPSCPPASEIGTVSVGAGSGAPFFVQGHAYLAGPYKGAPLSVAIVTPAVAGPFDLGTVVVRTALYINETTAQATVKSDPLPSILQGIPLDLRTIAVKIDRPSFALNPTSCSEKAVSGEAISTAGSAAALRDRFQVGGCKGLDFSPKLSLSMKGATRRSGHPAFKAVLTQPKEQANIASTAVILPPTEFIDQNHIANPCTRAQFNVGQCPPSSVLGRARAFTPLLEKPLEGPVYFRSNGGERELPDVVVALRGQVPFTLVGFVDAVHRKGSESSRVRTRFATVPDAPVSKFILELNGGKKGLLVNSANICKVANLASVKMAAQNNKAHDVNQRIGTSCSAK
jgi:hypothetical protein